MLFGEGRHILKVPPILLWDSSAPSLIGKRLHAINNERKKNKKNWKTLPGRFSAVIISPVLP